MAVAVSNTLRSMSGPAFRGRANPRSKSVGALCDTVERASVTWSLTPKSNVATGGPKIFQRLRPLEPMGSKRPKQSFALPTMNSQLARAMDTGLVADWCDRSNLRRGAAGVSTLSGQLTNKRTQKQPLRANLSFSDLKVMQKVVEEKKVVVDTDERDQNDHVGTSAMSRSSPRSSVKARMTKRLFDAVKKSRDFGLRCDRIRFIYSEARNRHHARPAVRERREQPSSPRKAGEVREILRDVLEDVLLAVKVCGAAENCIGIVKGLAQERSIRRSKAKAAMQRSLSKLLAVRTFQDVSLSMTREQSAEVESKWAALRDELSNATRAEKELASHGAFRAEPQEASGETCATLDIIMNVAETAEVTSGKNTKEEW